MEVSLANGAEQGDSGHVSKLVEELHAQMRQSSYQALRSVLCEHRDGAVVVSGRVPSYYLKQVAMTIVLRQLNGCVRVEDRLHVETDGVISTSVPAQWA